MSNKSGPESAWERSPFAMTSGELDVHEAVNALSRLLHNTALSSLTLEVVRHALELLRSERDSAA